MSHRHLLLTALFAVAFTGAHAADNAATPPKPEPYVAGKTLTRNVQAGISPDSAIAILKDGNARFSSGKPLQRDYKAQVSQTALMRRFLDGMLITPIDGTTRL